MLFHAILDLTPFFGQSFPTKTPVIFNSEKFFKYLQQESHKLHTIIGPAQTTNTCYNYKKNNII